MYPNIFALAAADAAVKAALGPSPVRFFLFGKAPQGVALPYAVWRTVTGSPENELGDVPVTDNWLLQVDVYASSAESVRSCSKALSDVAEKYAYVARWGEEDRDKDTKNYHYSFDVEWIQAR